MITPIIIHNPFKWNSPMTWLYAAIRWYTNSYWNHGAIIIELYGLKYVIEGTWHPFKASGVIATPYDAWLGRAKDRQFKAIKIPIRVLNTELRYRTLECLGKPYDFSIYLHFLTKGKYHNHSKNGLWCFELIKEVYKESLSKINFITGKHLEKYVID